MTKEIIKVDNHKIWLTIDHIRIYDDNGKLEDFFNLNFCYFKLSEPNLIFGELFRDKENKIMYFQTEQTAINYAKKELQNRYNELKKQRV